MSERSSQEKRSRDSNAPAARIVLEATALGAPLEEEISEDQKNPNAVALGRLGGLKGGLARAARLTAEERSEIARKAAQARWRKREK